MEQTQPVKIKANVTEINTQSNEVYLESEQGEGWFPIKAPANIKYAKMGEAEITLVGDAITYLRNTAQGPPKQQYGGFGSKSYSRPGTSSSVFKSHTQSNPVPANDYIPEEKESKRIGMTKELTDSTLEEIRLAYNSLSMDGKWIVATNIFPIQGKPGKYDCMFFISEKREGFDSMPYLSVEEKDIDTMDKKDSDTPIKETNMGEF